MLEIRAGLLSDIERLADIEVAGSAMFATVGMFSGALRGPLSPSDIANLEQHVHAGALWVAGVDAGLAGYAMTNAVDGKAHLDQVTVDPWFAHRRIGQALIEHVADQARAAGHGRLTLTTYAEVPWNAPYYERLGFRGIAVDELTPGLLEIRRHEAAIGLDEWPRVAMVREL